LHDSVKDCAEMNVLPSCCLYIFWSRGMQVVYVSFGSALAVRERSAFVSGEVFVVYSAITLLCVHFVYWNCLVDPCLHFHLLGLRGDAKGPALEIYNFLMTTGRSR
jgi:hypothetical protein